MPNNDRTGPRGQGPRTGRGAGNCSPAGQNTTAPQIRPMGRMRGRNNN